jgi:hypothetical protein
VGRLLWEPLPSLARGCVHHVCCAVRGAVVALGWVVPSAPGPGIEKTASVELLRYDSEAEENMVTVLPPLSCGPVGGSVAVGIDESESDQGELLLIRGWGESVSEVRKVDLATGVCTAQPSLLSFPQGRPFKACTAGRLPDGRIVCAGSTSKMLAERTASRNVFVLFILFIYLYFHHARRGTGGGADSSGAGAAPTRHAQHAV